MLRVTAVTPLTPPRLRVEFNDGLRREIDCSPCSSSGEGSTLSRIAQQSPLDTQRPVAS